jgi:hypothetical protein
MLVKSRRLKEYPYNLKFRIAADFDNLCHILATGGSTQSIVEVISNVAAGGVSDVRRDKVYEECEAISGRYFGVSVASLFFYRRKKIWEKIKYLIKKSMRYDDPRAK